MYMTNVKRIVDRKPQIFNFSPHIQTLLASLSYERLIVVWALYWRLIVDSTLKYELWPLLDVFKSWDNIWTSFHGLDNIYERL